MFHVANPTTKEVRVVYAVHKSGPLNCGEQTKFLIRDKEKWAWVYAYLWLPVLHHRNADRIVEVP